MSVSCSDSKRQPGRGGSDDAAVLHDLSRLPPPDAPVQRGIGLPPLLNEVAGHVEQDEMKIVAIMPVRNEDWILGLSARAVLMWADELVILDHCSTDGSVCIADEIWHEYPDRVTIHMEFDPVWEEMRHRQKLLEMARGRGATHIAIVDADEVLSGNLLPDIRYYFDGLPKGRVMQIPWLCLRGSIHCVHTSGPWADGQNVSMGFVDSPELHWSSESRGGYDFHHRNPMGRVFYPCRPVFDRKAGLMHLQFVSDRRLRAKQALYKATEVLRWPDREPVHIVDQRYNLAVYGKSIADGQTSRETTGAADASWWKPYAHLMEHFHPDAEPWQEVELRRLVAEHGRQRFDGLDLFGVA